MMNRNFGKYRGKRSERGLSLTELVVVVAIVLVIAAIGQIVNCGAGSVGYLLLMSGNQRRLIRVQFVMVAVSLLMNVTLIPVLGIVGAAVFAQQKLQIHERR